MSSYEKYLYVRLILLSELHKGRRLKEKESNISNVNSVIGRLYPRMFHIIGYWQRRDFLPPIFVLFDKVPSLQLKITVMKLIEPENIFLIENITSLIRGTTFHEYSWRDSFHRGQGTLRGMILLMVFTLGLLTRHQFEETYTRDIPSQRGGHSIVFLMIYSPNRHSRFLYIHFMNHLIFINMFIFPNLITFKNKNVLQV